MISSHNPGATPALVYEHPARSDAEGIAEVHVASWRSAYRGLLPDALLDGLRVEDRARHWRERLATDEGRARVWVAKRGGTIVGFASFGPSRDEGEAPRTGELYAIYLLEEAWGAGAGRALCERAKEALAVAGFAAMTVWVLSTNARARRFYERMGMTLDEGAVKIEDRCANRVEARYRVALDSP